MLKNYITVESSFKIYCQLAEHLTADITCLTAAEIRILRSIERKTARERIGIQKIKWNVKMNT
jgi:hypothetical protein